MAIEYRPLAEADAERFAALRLHGIRAYPTAFLLTEAEARSMPKERVEAALGKGGFIGAFHGADLVGFIAQHPMRLTQTAHRAEIGPFYVRPDHQGTGAAHALMVAAVTAATTHGTTQLELSVESSNHRARAFYTDHGFQAFATHPGIARMGGATFSDVLMRRDLTVPLPRRCDDGLQRLSRADWRAFHDIRIEMLTLATHSFGTMPEEWATKAPDEVADWIGKTNLWAVVDKGRILSCLGWHRFPGQVQAHRGHVVAVYTRPEAQRRGHVRALLGAAKAEAVADSIIQFELDVGADNTAARAAYEAHGFTVTGGTPRALNHAGHIHNQLYMVCPLSNG